MTTFDGVVDFEIKRGDTSPSMEVTCRDGATPVPLDNAEEVRLVGTLFTGNTPESDLVIDRVVEGDENGVVEIEWEEVETAEAGDLRLEVQVTLVGGKKQSFPKDGQILVRVYSDVVVEV